MVCCRYLILVSNSLQSLSNIHGLLPELCCVNVERSVLLTIFTNDVSYSFYIEIFGQTLHYEGAVAGVHQETGGGGDYHHVPGNVVHSAQAEYIAELLLQLPNLHLQQFWTSGKAKQSLLLGDGVVVPGILI